LIGRVSSTTTIGREREIAVLGDVLAAAQEGRPSLLLISGESGVGKTRLVGELEADARSRGFVVLHGECVEFGGEDLPYAPIVAALRNLPRELLAGALEGLHPDSRRELGVLRPIASARPGEAAFGPFAGESGQGRVYELLLELLRRLAESGAPILMVFEDLHWGDRSSRNFLAFFVRNLPQGHLVLAATYRTDTGAADGPLGGLLAELVRHPRTVPVEVGPLSHDEVRRQVAAIAGDVPAPGVADDIWQRTSGNPFYVEELLMARRHGHGGDVPSTVAEIARARVNELAPAARRLLHLIAASGHRAELALLESIVSADDLDEAAAQAVNAHLLVFDESGSSIGFRHALIGDAIYKGLLPRERMQLHGEIADALARSPVSEDAQLAYHWYGAGVWEAALAASARAADAAARRYAFAEARTQFERALELWERLGADRRPAEIDRGRLLAGAAEAARFTGDYAAAIDLCRDAIDEVDAGAQPLRAAMLHERVGEYLYDDDEAAMRSFAAAAGLLPGDAQAERAHLLTAEGRALLRMRRYDDARLRCQEALAIARAVGSDRVTTTALATLGMTLTLLGDPIAGARRLHQALDMARAQGAVEDLGHALMHLGETYRLQGRHAAALQTMDDGEAEARRWGVQGSFGTFMRVNAVDDLLRLGRWSEAEARLADLAHVDLGSMGTLLHHALRGQLCAQRGQLADARGSLAQASAVLRHSASSADFIPAVEGGWAMLALAEGRPAVAREHAAVGLVAMAEAGAAETFYTPILHGLGLRAEAELAEHARARRAASELEAGRARAAALVADLDALIEHGADRSQTPEAQAHRTLVQAEFTRVVGDFDPDAWDAAARRWDELGEPHPAAYARHRQADALLCSGFPAAAAPILRAAHATADALRADPLKRDIEDLARRARLDLRVDRSDPPPAAAPSAADTLGLTVREVEVLGLLAGGLTNREIAARLFISQKTAGTHVAHIFEKLDVHNRVEASAVAHRVGIVDNLHGPG
jgi:ATP/maltotriose-dependent transcriptional regulator MalT